MSYLGYSPTKEDDLTTDPDRLTITELADTLSESDLITTDWSETLSAAPGVIVILGESMVLASVPNAAQVRIKQEHLSGIATEKLKNALLGFTLPSTLFECTQIGQTAFLKAHTGMSKIRLHSENIVPTINQIAKLYDGGSARAGNADQRLLDMLLRKLKRSATICTDESLKIKEEFDWWSTFTKGLARAVEGTRGEVDEEKGEHGQKLAQQKAVLTVAQTEARLAKQELDARRAHRDHRLRQRDEVLHSAAVAVTASMPVGGPLVGLTVATAAGAAIDAEVRVKNAEMLVERRRKAMDAAELARVRLVAEMRMLQAKDAKLADVVRILKVSLERLKKLQQHINNLLIFFTEISDYVELLVNDTIAGDGLLDQMALAQNIDPKDRTACINRSIYCTALSIKTRFLVMQKIAQTYSQVSREQILPGFHVIDSVSLTEMELSNPQVSNRSRRLTEYSLTATESIRTVVLERQMELQNGMQLIAEESARGLAR